MTGKITFYGHSTISLTLPDERVIVIDPWLTENPACPDGMKSLSRCDIMLLTHGHFDHVGDVEAIIDQHNPTIVGNLELCGSLEKKLGKGTYSGMNTGGTQNVDGVRVSLTPALHSSGVDSPSGPMYAGMPNGLVVAVDNLARVYHAGDTDVFTDMQLIQRIHEPDICILPIGDYFTMGAKGAAIAVEFLKPKAIIPVHYGTFPILDQSPEQFRSLVSAEYRDRIHALSAGDSIGWNSDGVE
ncbi:MAG: metal-dependent hydrolase [Planctomycetota bacterium]|jgi:L-ascorbate metabolism protein UlaG (beta-lactamase superfamily)